MYFDDEDFAALLFPPRHRELIEAIHKSMAAHGIARNSITALPFLKFCMTSIVTTRFNEFGLYLGSFDALLDAESSQIIETHNVLGIQKLDPINLRAVMVHDLVQINLQTSVISEQKLKSIKNYKLDEKFPWPVDWALFILLQFTCY